MKKLLLAGVGSVAVLTGSFNAAALPNPDTTGWIYYAAGHQAAYYNGSKVWQEDTPNRDWWADAHLNKLTNARYDAIDRPMVDAATQMLVEGMRQQGVDIKYKNIYTSGRLTASFTPSGSNNRLNFSIGGISLTGYANVKKSWYAEGSVKFNINNIRINGSYDYFNGNVVINSVNAPMSVDVDVDLNIPLLGDVLDPLIDSYVDDKIDSKVPTNLNKMFNGGSYSFLGVKDYIPLNKFMYQGVDYGMVLRDKLSQTNVINDNFSLTIGEIVVHRQYLSITLGSATYKRWTTGGKRPCSLANDPQCEL